MKRIKFPDGTLVKMKASGDCDYIYLGEITPLTLNWRKKLLNWIKLIIKRS